MHLQVDASSPVPLYAQVTEQVRLAIASGILRPGDRLPGIRELAERLAINPMTVVRAYNELIGDGVLVGRQGAGTYVSDGKGIRELSQAQRRKTARAWAEELAAKATTLGLARDEVLGIVREALDAAARRRAQAERRER